MTLAVLIVTCAVVGLCVGSFLNVLIYRYPIGLSVVRPRSMCPKCETTLSSFDNVPVLSWLVLRGKCRTCATPISKQYPSIEALTSVLFALIAAREGFSPVLPAMLLFAAGLVALSVIDIQTMKLPKSLVYGLLLDVYVLLFAASVFGHQWGRLTEANLVAAAWFSVFYLINRVSPRHLGFGDVRLSLVLGLALGWFGWQYALIAFYGSGIIGLIVVVVLGEMGRVKLRESLPFGPFLAAGSVFALLLGPVIVPFVTAHG